MTLFEVDQKYLKYKSEIDSYRFIHDPFNRISIHLWQEKPENFPESEGSITRFQVAMDNRIMEWKNSRLLFGEVDSGDDEFGIKRSPVMMMSENIDMEFIKKIVPVLKENQNIAGLKFIIQIIEKSGQM